MATEENAVLVRVYIYAGSKKVFRVLLCLQLVTTHILACFSARSTSFKDGIGWDRTGWRGSTYG